MGLNTSATSYKMIGGDRFYFITGTEVHAEKYIEITELPEDGQDGKIIFSDRGETLTGTFRIEDQHCIVWFGESDEYFSVVKPFMRNGELYLRMEMDNDTHQDFYLCD